MFISFETDKLSATDIAMLEALVKATPAKPAEPPAKAKPAKAPEAPAKEVEKPAKAKPTKPAEAPAKATEKPSKPTETPAAPDAPATAVPPADDDIQEAIKLASQMISQGKTAEVKTALSNAGAARVSELTGPAIASFMAELSNA